jgi:hypothetical protein
MNIPSDLKKVCADIQEYFSMTSFDVKAIIEKGTFEDGEYEGFYLINFIGDDSQIRPKDGKFYYFNFDNENEYPILLSADDIVDFIKGKYDAFGIADTNEYSISYLKGWLETMKSLVSILEDKIQGKYN